MNTRPPLDWFVLRASTRSEGRVASLLERKGYDILLPLGLPHKGSSKPAPLFPGYVFCQLDSSCPLPVLQTPGVQSLLGYGNQAIPLQADELSAIKALAKAPVHADAWPGLCAGKPVRIIRGSLTGIEGVLAEVRNARRVALRLFVLQRSVLLDISLDDIEMC